MGTVVHIDRDLQEMFEKLDKLKSTNIHALCVTCVRDKGVEEFFFIGSPAAIYQSLALAQAHIVQNYNLLEGCECACEEGEE